METLAEVAAPVQLDADAKLEKALSGFTPQFLSSNDGVGISFWIISMAMIGSTVFFIKESDNLQGHWKTSLNVGTLVTLIAGVHYFYMREYWVTYETAPTLYRYIDWSLTVPLQMIEFYLILKAVGPCPAGVFWRLMIGTVAMLAFGYAGETGSPALPCFIAGLAGWGFILMEIFTGEASQIKGGASTPVAVQTAFNTMRFIVSVGWSIYPLGYFFGYLTAQASAAVLNLIYNLADFVNKIAFVLVIWNAAVGEREAMAGH